ncbi:MAG TPA: glutathione S-transferase N-terminal domain-containing protein [Solirubrobacterales bacterium]|nr:glutathione S-transferase N-terminal domain-containing protein [Solirubrobacterales bacterium]
MAEVVGMPPTSYARPVAIKLHRCPNEWVKISAHPCWNVQKALDDEGISYQLVKGPLRASKRDELEQLSGQRKYPVIEFEDGRVYREESKEMVERIRAGKLLAADTEDGPADAVA